MYEDLISQLAASSNMGDQQRSIEEQKALALQLRGRMLAPPQATTPGAALGGLVSNIINGVSMGRYRDNDQQAQGALDAQRRGVLSQIPQDQVSPAQSRALSRSLGATQDPSLMSVGKGFENEAVAREKDDMLHAKLYNTLINTGIKAESARAIADQTYGKPLYVNTPGDLNHSGVITHPDPAAPGGLNVTPIGTSKPPGASGSGGVVFPPLDEAALDQFAHAAVKDPNVLSRMSKRDPNYVRLMNRMATLYPDHPYAESWAQYKGDVAAGVDNAKTVARIRPYERMLGKNAQIVLDAMDKIPDSEVMGVNAFTRGLGRQLGSAEIAQFDQALNAFSNEAARILVSGPTLAGMLTDSARRDLQAVHSGNFSKKQLAAVIKITEAEATNRLDSLVDEGIFITKRTGVRPPGAKPALPKATGVVPKRIKYDAQGNEVP